MRRWQHGDAFEPSARELNWTAEAVEAFHVGRSDRHADTERGLPAATIGGLSTCAELRERWDVVAVVQATDAEPKQGPAIAPEDQGADRAEAFHDAEPMRWSFTDPAPGPGAFGRWLLAWDRIAPEDSGLLLAPPATLAVPLYVLHPDHTHADLWRGETPEDWGDDWRPLLGTGWAGAAEILWKQPGASDPEDPESFKWALVKWGQWSGQVLEVRITTGDGIATDAQGAATVRRNGADSQTGLAVWNDKLPAGVVPWGAAALAEFFHDTGRWSITGQLC